MMKLDNNNVSRKTCSPIVFTEFRILKLLGNVTFQKELLPIEITDLGRVKAISDSLQITCHLL